MTINADLWRFIPCVACGRQADHALELLLPVPRGRLTPIVMGFCARHYRQARRLPQWKELPIVEAEVRRTEGSRVSAGGDPAIAIEQWCGGGGTMTTEMHEGIVDVGPRCGACGKKLAQRLTRPWEIRCVRCKATNRRGQQ